jgi:sucrose-6-phosphate hydrolase SacC (GH32 family)
MPETPKMMFSDTSRLGRPFAKDPVVVRFGGRYLMYYSIPPYAPELKPKNGPEGLNIGIAESDDLYNWRKIGEMVPGQECDRTGLGAPGAIVLGGKLHLFYQTYGTGKHDAICHAVSTDGVSFTRDPSNPVFRPTGDWNCGRAIDADVIEHEGRLLLLCATRDPEMKRQMLVAAAAPLSSSFARKDWVQLCDAPVLKPELPWEQDCIEAPALCRRGKDLFLFYAGAYNNAPQQIGCATSTDGVHWTRLSKEPFLANGKPGEWNSSESGHPGLFTDEDGRTYLFYQGNNDHGRTWFLSCVEVEWDKGRPRVKQ